MTQRYRFVPDTFDSLARMDGDPDGEWVRFDAVAALLDERDALRAALMHIAEGDLTARDPRVIARLALGPKP